MTSPNAKDHRYHLQQHKEVVAKHTVHFREEQTAIIEFLSYNVEDEAVDDEDDKEKIFPNN